MCIINRFRKQQMLTAKFWPHLTSCNQHNISLFTNAQLNMIFFLRAEKTGRNHVILKYS